MGKTIKTQKAGIDVQLDNWLNHMKPEDQAEAYLMMERAWQTDDSSFVGLLAERAWDKRKEIAEALAGAKWLKYDGRPVKTIALYYRWLRNGGTQRVVAMLGSRLAELRDDNGRPRYNVLIITDDEPQETDYPVSPLVIREQLPPFQTSVGQTYAPRAEAWARIITKHGVDAVLYSLWENPYLLWDLLSVKRAARHPAFVIHTHSMCNVLYEQKERQVKQWQAPFRLANGIVALSEIDRLYWSRFNPRSICIPNPCFVKASECRRATCGKHILWLGRISRVKQPLEIVRIMREAVARDPEIICHVVGACNAALEKRLEKSIAAEGLSEHVILEGFHKDVEPWYECCSLFLMTSRCEGFSLTLYEAAAYGLPTVLYELPWLSYNELIDGAVTVPQRDASAAAAAIVRLVNDPEEWQRRSEAIYDSARRYEKTDITAYWLALIESLEQDTLPEKPHFDRQMEILLNQIDASHDDAVSSLTGELNFIRGSALFRLGHALTWLPRKICRGVRCYIEYDAKYTFERILFHLHLGPDNDWYDKYSKRK